MPLASTTTDPIRACKNLKAGRGVRDHGRLVHYVAPSCGAAHKDASSTSRAPRSLDSVAVRRPPDDARPARSTELLATTCRRARLALSSCAFSAKAHPRAPSSSRRPYRHRPCRPSSRWPSSADPPRPGAGLATGFGGLEPRPARSRLGRHDRLRRGSRPAGAGAAGFGALVGTATGANATPCQSDRGRSGWRGDREVQLPLALPAARLRPPSQLAAQRGSRRWDQAAGIWIRIRSGVRHGRIRGGALAWPPLRPEPAAAPLPAGPPSLHVTDRRTKRSCRPPTRSPASPQPRRHQRASHIRAGPQPTTSPD